MSTYRDYEEVGRRAPIIPFDQIYGVKILEMRRGGGRGRPEKYPHQFEEERIDRELVEQYNKMKRSIPYRIGQLVKYISERVH